GLGALTGSADFTGNAINAVNASATPYTITPTVNTLSATNYDFPVVIFVNGTLTINKATAGIVIHDYSDTYDAHSHGVTAIITGVDSGGTAAGSNFSSETLTNVPGGTVAWSFSGGTNYKDDSGTGNVTISKAFATINVTAYTSATTIYDGLSHTASVTSITGVNGETGSTVGSVDVSHTVHINAGTYSSDYWFFTGGINYNHIGKTTITDSIGKATAAILVTPYTVTYDGHPHTAGVTSITG